MGERMGDDGGDGGDGTGLCFEDLGGVSPSPIISPIISLIRGV